jgi:hypothetical protein
MWLFLGFFGRILDSDEDMGVVAKGDDAKASK